MMDISPAEIATIRMNITIAAPTDEVWRALIHDIGDWWPAEFYSGGTPGEREFQLEAEPGGRMFERWADGGGVLWGTVMAIEPGSSLQVLGHLFPNWGGPSQWFGTWALAGKGETTTLSFTETALGKVSKAGMLEKQQGWQFLWATLKAHVEGDDAPEWPQ